MDITTLSTFSKVRKNSLSNVICSSQPHYVVKRWTYKAGTRMEIFDSEQRLEHSCLHCSVQMLVSQKLIFHCSLDLLYFFFLIVMFLLTLPTKQIVYELAACVRSSYTCPSVGIFILCIVGHNCCKFHKDDSPVTASDVWLRLCHLQASWFWGFFLISCWNCHILGDKIKNYRISFHKRPTIPALNLSLSKFTIILKQALR